MRDTTAARVLVVQALYQYDLRGEAFREEAQAFLAASAKNERVLGLSEALLHGCLKRRDELDARIAGAAEHWDVYRMAVVDRCVLRLAVYELLHRPAVPHKVAVDEAIRLAKKYGSAESGAFVNGILDRIMASCGPSEAASGQEGP